MCAKDKSNTFVWGFVAGAAAAAVYTLLKTPRSGQETVGQIKDQGVKLKTQVEELFGQARPYGQDAASSWQQTTWSTAQDWQKQAEDVAQQAQSAVEDVAQQTQATVEDVADQARSIVDDSGQQIEEQAVDAVDALQGAVDDATKSVKETLAS